MRRLGKQEPRYRFFLNPYQDVRFTRCPSCDRKTRQRKLPLVIHVEPKNMTALNKTCRYCPHCDLLIAHQDDLEANLAALYSQSKPEVVGNDYLVLGTIDRADWRTGMQSTVTVQSLLERMHDFKEEVQFTLSPQWTTGE